LNASIVRWLLGAILIILLSYLVSRWMRQRRTGVQQAARRTAKESGSKAAAKDDLAASAFPADNAQTQRLLLAERKRIGRDLHDSTMQSLYAIGLRLEHQANNAELPEEVRKTLEEILEDLRVTMARMRLYVDQLASVEEMNVQQHLQMLVEELQRQLLTPISYEVKQWQEPNFGTRTVQEIGMIMREAVTNAVRHGKAQRIVVALQSSDQSVLLSIIDDGQGFKVTEERTGTHYGLKHMRERAALLGGRLLVHSTVGKGTTVTLRVPLR